MFVFVSTSPSQHDECPSAKDCNVEPLGHGDQQDTLRSDMPCSLVSSNRFMAVS